MQFSNFTIIAYLIPLFSILIFVIVILGILFAIFKSLKQYFKNNASPILNVEAKLVSKRTNISTIGNNANDNFHNNKTSNNYYATFEFESGDRLEFLIPSHEYGLIVEGDIGKLKFQGTRYLEFGRKKL